MPLPLLIPIAAATISAIGGIAGGIGSAAKQKKADKELQSRRDQAQKRFLQESNTDYLDTAAAKSTIAALRKQGDRQLEKLNTEAVKSGASDEAKIAAASRINENSADAISRLAGFGTQYQQQIKDRYYHDTERLDDALYNSKINQAQTTAGIIDAASGAAGSLLSAWGSGAFNKTPKTPAIINPGTIGKIKKDINPWGYKHPITGQWMQI